MIKVESITITEFRGIRDLTLQFHGRNFAICGPNGTGKSGVVDALEFALTGTISRLTGEGRGDVSVKAHAPHVDHRDNPQNAKVSITVAIPSLGKTATVERNAKTPTVAAINPADEDIVAVIEHLQNHPEIVLSRRELIRYVLATPGQRSEEIQALLHLDAVKQVRASLLKIANQFQKQVPLLGGTTANARSNLLEALDITELNVVKVLEATNLRRSILGLSPLAELREDTSLKDGLAAPPGARPQTVPKNQALADIEAVSPI